MLLLPLSTVAATPAAIVSNFFPPVLTHDADEAIPADELQSAFVVGTVDASGSQLIVAVYCNGFRGVVRVLSPAGDGALIAESAPIAMTGRRASVELVDLAHSGIPQIIVTMDQARGVPIAWVFALSGGRIDLLGPFRSDQADDYVASDLADPTFLDITGNGVLAVVDHHAGHWCDDDGNQQAAVSYRLFQFTGGAFHMAGTLDYFRKFTRSSGAPVLRKDSFAARDTTAQRQLIVVNGERDGTARVTSARITLNGVPVVAPSAFNEQVGAVRVPVMLQSTNNIAVELSGKPGSGLRILLLPLQ